MKVQFIWPNFDCPIGPAIGVSYVSGMLKKEGHDTSCIHINELLEYSYDLEDPGRSGDTLSCPGFNGHQK